MKKAQHSLRTAARISLFSAGFLLFVVGLSFYVGFFILACFQSQGCHFGAGWSLIFLPLIVLVSIASLPLAIVIAILNALGLQPYLESEAGTTALTTFYVLYAFAVLVFLFFLLCKFINFMRQFRIIAKPLRPKRRAAG